MTNTNTIKVKLTMTNTIKVKLTLDEIEAVYALCEADLDNPLIRSVIGKMAVAAQQQVETENV